MEVIIKMKNNSLKSEGGFIVSKEEAIEIQKAAIVFVNEKLLPIFAFRLLCEANKSRTKNNKIDIDLLLKNEPSKPTPEN